MDEQLTTPNGKLKLEGKQHLEQSFTVLTTPNGKLKPNFIKGKWSQATLTTPNGKLKLVDGSLNQIVELSYYP